MRVFEFGELTIEIKPTTKPNIMTVDMTAQNRKGIVHMETNKDESVDQISMRLKGMMRALYNNEMRDAKVEEKKLTGPSYVDDKQAVKAR